MSIVTVLVLAIFVLPKFEDFFADLDAELPLPTRMLLGVTDFLGDWWWAMLAAARRAGAARASSITRTSAGQVRARRAAAARSRCSGTTIQYALVERFCRVLGVDGRAPA